MRAEVIYEDKDSVIVSVEMSGSEACDVKHTSSGLSYVMDSEDGYEVYDPETRAGIRNLKRSEEQEVLNRSLRCLRKKQGEGKSVVVLSPAADSLSQSVRNSRQDGDRQ